MTQPFSAGALASTVDDLIRWQRGLVNGSLLQEKSRKAMTKKGVLLDGKESTYGMGLFIRQSVGRPMIGHGGGINGFRSDLAYYPESDHTIVVLANSESADPGRISQQIARHVIASTTKQECGLSQQTSDRIAVILWGWFPVVAPGLVCNPIMSLPHERLPSSSAVRRVEFPNRLRYLAN